jgi:uncharacterized protein
VTAILADAGPLIALLDRRDRYHSWSRSFFDAVTPPIFTCEPVVAECCYILRRLHGGEQKILGLITAGIVSTHFRLQPESEVVASLMRNYSKVPMSLADACLVRMTELEHDSAVVTFDSDFRIYRRNKRQAIRTIMPD